MTELSEKDYKLLKSLEHGARSRSELGGSDPEIAARLTRLLELGFVVPDVDLDMIRETRFELTAEGRAYIRDHKDETRKKRINFVTKDVTLPVVLGAVGAVLTIIITILLTGRPPQP